MTRWIALIALITALLPLNGCSDKDSPSAKEETRTDQELYDAGLTALEERYYQRAVKELQEIERLYPFSKLSTRAQVMAAYALYRDEEYDDAITLIDRFTRLNPGNKDVAYMYYLKSLSYYDRIADVKRDQKITRNALSALEELIRRYPESAYARDARLKKDLVVDHLAGKDMEVGRFYLQQRKFIAAINRFRSVIDEFETTTHAPEALYRMTEAYLSLGIPMEAQKYAAVLGHNYPDSRWYHYAYRLVEEGEATPKEQRTSWFRKLIPFETNEDEVAPLPEDNLADSWIERIIPGF